MILKRCEWTGTWSAKLPIIALAVYFLLLFPAVRIVFRLYPLLSQYAFVLYMAAVPGLLIALKKIDWRQLGFSREHLLNHLTIGGVLGVGVLLTLPALDTMIALSGLAEHELFKNAERAAAARDLPHTGWLALAVSVLIAPLIQQAFFNGFVLQGLSRRFNPVLMVYAVAVLFTLAQFKLSLGLFLLGGITAFLFRATGTLYASWVFHACCALAGHLVATVYPRLITLVVFLF